MSVTVMYIMNDENVSPMPFYETKAVLLVTFVTFVTFTRHYYEESGLFTTITIVMLNDADYVLFLCWSNEKYNSHDRRTH